MDTTSADVYREVQKIFLNSQSILLLNNDLENKNFISDMYMTPEDRDIKENTCVNKVTNIMVTYQSLEEHVLRLENSVHGPMANQQDIVTRVKLAKSTFCSRVNNLIDRLTQLLISRTSVIDNTTAGKKNAANRSYDMRDSIERNIMKLKRQIKQ